MHNVKIKHYGDVGKGLGYLERLEPGKVEKLLKDARNGGAEINEYIDGARRKYNIKHTGHDEYSLEWAA